MDVPDRESSLWTPRRLLLGLSVVSLAIVAKLARTAISHQQQRDVARRAAGLPARENRAQLFRHARAAVPALVRLMLAFARVPASAARPINYARSRHRRRHPCVQRARGVAQIVRAARRAVRCATRLRLARRARR